jgi:hypothetical protein
MFNFFHIIGKQKQDNNRGRSKTSVFGTIPVDLQEIRALTGFPGRLFRNQQGFGTVPLFYLYQLVRILTEILQTASIHVI